MRFFLILLIVLILLILQPPRFESGGLLIINPVRKKKPVRKKNLFLNFIFSLQEPNTTKPKYGAKFFLTEVFLMTNNEAREFILEHSTTYFERDKSGKGFICPICGSGTGEHGTGITENPHSPSHFTCWAGCFTNADIFEIISKQYNTTDFQEQMRIACGHFGISVDDNSKPRATANDRIIEKDYTEFFKEALKHINETEYHRGLSIKTLNEFTVGYVSEWQHPKISKAPKTPRLIIPTSNGYLARDTRKTLAPKEKKFAKMRVGVPDPLQKTYKKL